MQIDYVDHLPDCYRQDKNSNNYKLLEIHRYTKGLIHDDLAKIREMCTIAKATGKTLDMYGKMFNQSRGAMTDEQYRVAILVRISRYLVGGDIPTILDALVAAFQCEYSDISISDSTTGFVKVLKLPITVINAAGFSSTQAKQLITSLLPVGVGCVIDNLEGTFEFAATESEYDEDAGFADDAQTIGGFLGMTFGVDTDNPLPI